MNFLKKFVNNRKVSRTMKSVARCKNLLSSISEIYNKIHSEQKEEFSDEGNKIFLNIISVIIEFEEKLKKIENKLLIFKKSFNSRSDIVIVNEINSDVIELELTIINFAENLISFINYSK